MEAEEEVREVFREEGLLSAAVRTLDGSDLLLRRAAAASAPRGDARKEAQPAAAKKAQNCHSAGVERREGRGLFEREERGKKER